MHLHPARVKVQRRPIDASQTLCARRNVSAEHSDMPIWSNLPSALSFASVATASSTGTLASTRAHSNKSRRFVPLSFSLMRLTLLARFSGLYDKNKSTTSAGWVHSRKSSTYELSVSYDMYLSPPFSIQVYSHSVRGSPARGMHITDLDRQKRPLRTRGISLKELGNQLEVRGGEIMPVKFTCSS